jgi:hypothetical protein
MRMFSTHKVHNLPRIKLSDLLRRRRTNLKAFLLDQAITTYASLVERCDRLGVQFPSEAEFRATKNPLVSDPTEGVVVVQQRQLKKTNKRLPTTAPPPPPTEELLLPTTQYGLKQIASLGHETTHENVFHSNEGESLPEDQKPL